MLLVRRYRAKLESVNLFAGLVCDFKLPIAVRLHSAENAWHQVDAHCQGLFSCSEPVREINGQIRIGILALGHPEWIPLHIALAAVAESRASIAAVTCSACHCGNQIGHGGQMRGVFGVFGLEEDDISELIPWNGINRRFTGLSTIPFGQRAVDPQLNAAGGKQVNVRCRLAGCDIAADPECPSPDAWFNLLNRILDTSVHHLQITLRITDDPAWHGAQVGSIQNGADCGFDVGQTLIGDSKWADAWRVENRFTGRARFFNTRVVNQTIIRS
jgi:hypothetical protein